MALWRRLKWFGIGLWIAAVFAGCLAAQCADLMGAFKAHQARVGTEARGKQPFARAAAGPGPHPPAARR